MFQREGQGQDPKNEMVTFIFLNGDACSHCRHFKDIAHILSIQRKPIKLKTPLGPILSLCSCYAILDQESYDNLSNSTTGYI